MIVHSTVEAARRAYPEAAILRPVPDGVLVFHSVDDARGHYTAAVK